MRILILGWFLLAAGTTTHAQLISFTEESRQRGIDHHFFSNIPMGGGAAFLDVDQDGDQDLFVVGGSRPDRLFLNDGSGQFTEQTNLRVMDEVRKYSTMGVTAGDLDNDGWPDLVLTTFDGPDPRTFERVETPCIVLRNLGDGQFERIPESSGLNISLVSHSVTLMDVNRDGYLDIYESGHVDRPRLLRDENGLVVGYDHECFRNLLYVNQGDMTFREQAADYGLDDPGCGLAQLTTDYDQDGDQDLYLANDFGMFLQPNVFFRNNYPEESFTNVAPENGAGVGMFAMGIAAADFDHDLDLDYYVTNIGANALLRQHGGLFDEVAHECGVANEKIDDGDLNTTGWGTAFVDVDHDGWEDLFVSNGHIGTLQAFLTGREDPNQLFRNRGDGTFTDVSSEAGIMDRQVGRGLAVADVDGDGDQDVFGVVLGTGEEEVHSKLYINQSEKAGHYVQIGLEGTRSNRDAIGAQVRVYAGDMAHLRELEGGGASYCSKSSNILHVGLGEADRIDSLVIHWPSGQTDRYGEMAVDRKLDFVERGEVTSAPTIHANHTLSIAKNPTNTTIDLIGDLESGTKWTLLNTVGQVVQSGITGPGSGRTHITDVSLLPKGMYYLRIQGESGKSTFPVVISQ
jgi:enediyne biosynthesis protein E4